VLFKIAGRGLFDGCQIGRCLEQQRVFWVLAAVHYRIDGPVQVALISLQ